MASVNNVHFGNFGADLYNNLTKCRVLVVGAGGIGCELLKTLVLSGFGDIEVIDLDTIDVSNLNRQFLFQKQHVGKSKASVARHSALQFNPDAEIKAYHDSIMSADYDVNFFRRFAVVLNALDNRAARNHVNRMCLAADVPLVESGSAGYLGQVTLIKKGQTECYECQPKPHQKSYPGCTIRNTPSEPVHCIVWAKHLFNQLFGEADADEEVSPDTEDPEAGGIAGEMANTAPGGELQRTSTQEWAKSIEFDPEKLVRKLFVEDIKYLLSMDKLWKDRKPPAPLDLDNLTNSGVDNNSGLSDQKIWSVKECVEIFHNCVAQLKTDLEKKQDYLVWDKDDKAALDFVVSACNIRAYIFSIPQKSRFDVKSMAGNIIPAIATTNAVISGLIVLEAIKVINGDLSNCRTTYLNKKPSSRKKLLQPSRLVPPNEKCYACSSKPEVTVMLDCSKISVKVFEEKLLKNEFGVLAPDVEIDDGKGTILISSEEGETEQNNTKMLTDFKIGNGSRLKVEDFFQNYELVVNIVQSATIPDGEDFKIVDEVPKPDSVGELKSPRKIDRKRKASDNVQGEIESKHLRIDAMINHTMNQSVKSDVMVIGDDTPTNSAVGNQSGCRNLENGNKDLSPVVLIVDNDTVPCKSPTKLSKKTSNAQIVIEDEEINDDIIML